MYQNEKLIPVETRVNAALVMIEEISTFDFNSEIHAEVLSAKYGDIKEALSDVSCQLSAEIDAFKIMKRNHRNPTSDEMLGLRKKLEKTLDQFKEIYRDLMPIYKNAKEIIISDSKQEKNKTIKLDHINKYLEFANNVGTIIVTFLNFKMMNP